MIAARFSSRDRRGRGPRRLRGDRRHRTRRGIADPARQLTWLARPRHRVLPGQCDRVWFECRFGRRGAFLHPDHPGAAVECRAAGIAGGRCRDPVQRGSRTGEGHSEAGQGDTCGPNQQNPEQPKHSRELRLWQIPGDTVVNSPTPRGVAALRTSQASPQLFSMGRIDLGCVAGVNRLPLV